MARFQPATETMLSAAVRGALTGLVLVALAVVGIAQSVQPSQATVTAVDLPVATAALDAGPPVMPLPHTAPIHPAA